MTEPTGYQHGVPCWVDTWQRDADAAMSFYTQIFAWDAEDTMPDGVEGTHYMCRLRGRDVAAVASRKHNAPDAIAWTTYVWVDDVDATLSKALDAGGNVLVEPFDSLDVGRIAIVADPAGAAIGIWHPGAHGGAQVINEPSAWAMSFLRTTDTEGAKRFYASAFGWEHEGFGDGMTLFKVPGYVGGTPSQPVPRDVVATMTPADEDGEAPHWGVDFWIADVDAAAAKVAELGGQVIAPPYDIPGIGMRQGVFADPQGAVFSLTRPPGLEG